MRLYNPKTDYPLLCEWWKHYGHPEVPENLLSSTGIMWDDLAAGFVYTTNSNLAFIDFIVANPHMVGEGRKKILHALCEDLCAYAFELGASALYVMITRPSMVQLGLELGFTAAEEKPTIMWKSRPRDEK